MRWLALLALSACVANEQLVPPADVARAVPSDQGRIYVVRAWRGAGSAISMEIHEDQALVGHLAAGYYMAWDHEPGRTMLFTMPAGAPGPTLDLDVKPGETRYVEARVENITQGFREQLAEVSPGVGAQLVSAARPMR